MRADYTHVHKLIRFETALHHRETFLAAFIFCIVPHDTIDHQLRYRARYAANYVEVTLLVRRSLPSLPSSRAPINYNDAPGRMKYRAILAHSYALCVCSRNGVAEIITRGSSRAGQLSVGSVTSRKSFSIPVTADPKSVPRLVPRGPFSRQPASELGPKRTETRSRSPTDRAHIHTRARSREKQEASKRSMANAFICVAKPAISRQLLPFATTRAKKRRCEMLPVELA